MKSLGRSRSLRANTSPLPAESPGREREPFFLGPFRQQRNVSLPSTPSRNKSRANGENVPPDNNHATATAAYVKANTPTADTGSPALPKSTKKGRNGGAIPLPPLQASPTLLTRTPSAKPSPVGPKLESQVAHGQDNLATAKRKLYWDGSGSTVSDTVGAAAAADTNGSDSGVKVIIRMRPLNNKEEQEVAARIVQKASLDTVTLGDQQFTYDAIASEVASQLDVFEMVGLPMVENCLAGFNSSIFAYGQTGSGKTHTMMGVATEPNSSLYPNDQRGLTPRVIERLFSRMEEEERIHVDKGLSFQCRCSFLEIYNEQITDLLEPTQRNLQIREDTKTGVYVDSLTEEYVSNVDDVTRLLLKGWTNRTKGATIMNSESSRSHSVFTCVLESRFKNLADGGNSVRSSRMNLVDLAGSERQKQTGTVGERLKEAGNINKSLSQLGNVINILAEVAQTGKQRHIPYRDSRLTFLLQDSLGGNAKLAMICAISPASSCRNETLSTLRFAQRAKVIQNKAVVNEEASNDVGLLRKQIRQLKDELMRMKSNGSQEPGVEGYSNSWNARRSYNLLRLSLRHPMTLSAADLQEPDVEMEIAEDDTELETDISQSVIAGKDIAQHGFSRLSVIDEKDPQIEKTSIDTSVSKLAYATDRAVLHSSDTGFESLSNIDDDRVNYCSETTHSSEILGTAEVLPVPELIAPLHSPPQSVSPRLKGMSKRGSSVLSMEPGPIFNFPPGNSTCEEIYHSTHESFYDGTISSQSFQLNSDASRKSGVRASMSTARPTEKLAACLQRGLQILDNQQRTSISSVPRSTAALKSSVQGFDFLLPRMVEKFDKGVQTSSPVVVNTSTSPWTQTTANPAEEVSPSRKLNLSGEGVCIQTELSRSASSLDFLFRDPLPLTSFSDTVGNTLQDSERIRMSAGPDTVGVVEQVDMSSVSIHCPFQLSVVSGYHSVQQSDESVQGPESECPQLPPYVNLSRGLDNEPEYSLDALDDTPSSHHIPSGDKNCDTSNWQIVAVDGRSVPAGDESSSQLVPEVVRALLTGAIRRERAAEEAMSKQAAEIEQLNRLVRQYKHERECNAILHQSREDKIARLESLMDNVISMDEYATEEWSSLLLEYQMLQEKFHNHPEVTQSSVEQQRLLDELNHYRDFFDFGEREIILEEVKLLRNQVQTLMEHNQGNPSSTARQRRLSLARISVHASQLAEVVPECDNPTSLALLSTPDEDLQVGVSVKPSSALSMVVTQSINSQPRGRDLEDEGVGSISHSWEDEKRAMDTDWEEREREWMAVLEESREESQSYKRQADKRKQELDGEKRCTEEMQDALRMAMTGHARLLEQYAELQEKHIVLLGKHRKIKEGTADVKRMAKKAGVTSLEARWLDSQALQIATLKVEVEEEKQRSKVEIEGLKAQLRDTADAVQAAGELLVRLKEAEESIIIAQDAAAIAEQDAGGLRREMENARRRHVTEVATLQQRVLESRLQKTAVCPMCVMAERVKFQFTEADAESPDSAAGLELEAESMSPQQRKNQKQEHDNGLGWTIGPEEDQGFFSQAVEVDEVGGIDYFFTQN